MPTNNDPIRQDYDLLERPILRRVQTQRAAHSGVLGTVHRGEKRGQH
jgi:hypothetical protein